MPYQVQSELKKKVKQTDKRLTRTFNKSVGISKNKKNEKVNHLSSS